MPTLYLDYLNHNNVPVHQYVKVIDDQNQFVSIKENNDSQKSHTYLVTHQECDHILYDLHRKFNEKCDNLIAPNRHDHELYRALESRQFLRFLPVGSLGDFQDFQDLNCNDFTIGLIITNDYHLNGNLEIHLGYNHSISDNFNVIEKWSPSDKPSIFKKVEHQINPVVDNFNRIERSDLIKEIVDSAYNTFVESISQLNHFVSIANDYAINRNQITPIYLDLKNRNRSRTSLKTNKDRIKIISNDVKESKILIGRYHKEAYCYTDLLLWISIDRHRLYRNYDHFNDAELTSSQAYKDLVKKVASFSETGLKDEYEHEQTTAYMSIIDLLG